MRCNLLDPTKNLHRIIHLLVNDLIDEIEQSDSISEHRPIMFDLYQSFLQFGLE